MMTVIGFGLQFLVALVAGGLLFYMPGRLFIRMLRLHLSFCEHLTLSLCSGAALATMFFWGSAAIGWQWLIWPYALLCTGLEMWYHKKEMSIKALKVPDPDAPVMETARSLYPLWVITGVGILVQTRFIAWTAWPLESGMSLLAWHGCDAPWHVYNIFQFARQYPVDMTGFAGEVLRNYHMFTDLMWGAFYKFSNVDPWHLYFRIAPLFYSALLTLSTYSLTKAWTQKTRTALIAAAMMILSSNFGYLLPLIVQNKSYFLWDSLFWVQPPVTHMFNPGTAASHLFVLGGLWGLLKWLKEKQWTYLIVIALLWGVLPGFKAYPAVIVAIALVGTALLLGLFQKNWRPLLAGLVLLPVFMLVFIPPNLDAHQLIHFLPGYNLGTMLVAPDRMALMTSAALKALYLAEPLKVALLMAGLLLVFVIGNLGMRIIGLPQMIRDVIWIKRADPVVLFISLVTIAGLAGSVLFVQSGLRWSTIQFFYYVVLLSTLVAAKQFGEWTEQLSKRTQIIMLLLLFGFGFPGVIQSMLVINWKTGIHPDVYQGLSWLKNQTKRESVTLLHPLPAHLAGEEGFEHWQAKLKRGTLTSLKHIKADALDQQKLDQAGLLSPNPNQSLEQPLVHGLEQLDNNIVSALVFQNSYLAFLDRANIMGYDVLDRAKAVRYFYTQANVVEAREFLEHEKIKYVILYAENTLPFKPAGVPLKQVFKNQEVTIYKYINPGGW